MDSRQKKGGLCDIYSVTEAVHTSDSCYFLRSEPVSQVWAAPTVIKEDDIINKDISDLTLMAII